MTHSRSCTKQKMLLIYSLQSDYIKYTFCCTYFGMKRPIVDTGCLAAIRPEAAGGCLCPAVQQYPEGLALWKGGGQETKNCQFSVKSCNTALSSSLDLFFLFSPSFVCALYMHFSFCCFCALCDLVDAYIASTETAKLLVSLHLPVGFS